MLGIIGGFDSIVRSSGEIVRILGMVGKENLVCLISYAHSKFQTGNIPEYLFF